MTFFELFSKKLCGTVVVDIIFFIPLHFQSRATILNWANRFSESLMGIFVRERERKGKE